MAQRQDTRDIWQKALDVGVPAAVGGALGYAGARLIGKKARGRKMSAKIVSIRPVRELFKSAYGERFIKYWRDGSGRRYHPVVWSDKTGSWIKSFEGQRSQHMMRDDGVIFKLRKDGSYVMTLPKQPRKSRKNTSRRK